MFRLRSWLGFILALPIFAAVAFACRWAELYVLYGLYVGGEFVGLISAAAPLRGQILGHNIPDHPAWVEGLISFVAIAVSYAPALLVALLAYHRAAFGRVRRESRCAGCAAVLRGLTMPACPACGKPV